MARMEFIKLMGENMMILDRLLDRVKVSPVKESGYPRQLLILLLRLNSSGRARLKDIARREGASTSNLCAAFRRLERDGLVVRTTDKDDRRNVWYEVTEAGKKASVRASDAIRRVILEMFESMTDAEEVQMIASLKNMNKVLKNLELK